MAIKTSPATKLTAKEYEKIRLEWKTRHTMSHRAVSPIVLVALLLFAIMLGVGLEIEFNESLH